MKLSILCVTTDTPRAQPFLQFIRRLAFGLGDGVEPVILVDGKDLLSNGFIESVLDEAVTKCRGDYVLRIDDDEKVSPAMAGWLMREDYRHDDHWSFPRVHLWGDDKTIVMDPYYFPDVQTRLSVRAKSGGRPHMHQGSPFGAGSIARVCLEHHTFLVKSYEERCAISKFYQEHDAVVPGCTGTSFEDEHPGDVQFMEYSTGAIPMHGRVWTGTCANWRHPDGI